MKNNHILKFRKIDKFLIDSLVHSHIYFAPPDKLNDPFDCRIDIEKSLTKAISQSSDLGIKILGLFKHKEIQELINQAQKEIIMYGIFSGSHSPALNSSLMWSHYADSHRGVCLIYAIPTEPEEFYKPNQILGIQNVKYGINILTE
ncbi:MAG: DUF2971 domain-containing protein [Deltaproteobacteria bacterium]|nr:DUF2971 domain-containing protein [Deltaproteobacteria bacterium]